LTNSKNLFSADIRRFLTILYAHLVEKDVGQAALEGSAQMSAEQR